MVKLTEHGVVLAADGTFAAAEDALQKAEGKEKTMAYGILKTHNHSNNMEQLQLKFDALVSPDNNYVNILQTARASGIKKFPVPYVLSNCHHTLCAVGGTINEDDHVFGLGNAKKYGGIFVPPYRAVLHQYMREMMAGGGKMILGSDSHSRYGALGTMGIGEGGGEVAKQLLGRTYDIAYPPVLAVKLTGSPRPGVGPQDVALALIAATFQNNFNKNKVLEFVGDGVSNLSMEYRMGIDVMTTESAALSSVWCTDGKTEEFLAEHGRGDAYREMAPETGAYYDGLIEIDLSSVECMIALPFHPSNAMPIREFKERMPEVIKEIEEAGNKIKGKHGEPFSIQSHMRDGAFYVDQALVSGCSGGLFENIVAMADILKGYEIPGNGLNLGINPASLPIMADLMEQGVAGELAVSGATLRPCICGPCFGVTDVPANNQVSIRHMTRNYPNREGSKPGQGQMACACLMDARSIAATVRNGGKLTAATELNVEYRTLKHHFDPKIYGNQVFDNYNKGDDSVELTMGPNIADWPEMQPLPQNLLLKVVSEIHDPVTTTDELIPSGETSSYRSNPLGLAEFALSRKDPAYVGRAKEVQKAQKAIEADECPVEALEELKPVMDKIHETYPEVGKGNLGVGSTIFAVKPGDGSAREQAASCQKVLGGWANIANEYATKRYRSNLINWGMLPFLTDTDHESLPFKNGDYIFVPDVRKAVEEKAAVVKAYVVGDELKEIDLKLGDLTDAERQIILDGCLINYYRATK